jgi:ribosome-binding factor A
MPPTNINKHRRENMTEFIKNSAGDFFARNTTGASMITVTNVHITPDLKHADIFISVLPESKQDAAFNFAKRMRTDLQKFVLSRVKLNHLPLFDIVLDKSGTVYDKLHDIKTS